MPDKILLLITVDYLAPTDLPCYGNREVQLPSLDALVVEGVVYDEHYSPATFPQSSMKAWVTGQPSLLQEEDGLPQSDYCLTDELMEKLTSQEVHVSRIDCSENDFEDQVQKFFASAEKSNRSFCWLRLSTRHESSIVEKASQLENVIAQLQKNVEGYQETSIAWLLTSEQGQLIEEELPENISALYAAQLQQSLSRKLWRPLILSGNSFPEDCPQRIRSLTVSQDVHWTILDFLECEISSCSTSQSLLAGLSQLQQLDRQLLLLDENLAGLLTSTDLTVIAFNPDEESISPSARYYLKPEDRNDVNDLQTTAPEHVERRVVELRKLLGKIKQSEPS